MHGRMRWSCPTCKLKDRWYTTEFVQKHNRKYGVQGGAPHAADQAHGGGPHQAQRRDKGRRQP
ncbi:unnamed protein product [Urochloa humidicola]